MYPAVYLFIDGPWTPAAAGRTGWKPDFATLLRDGHRASVAEQPLTSFSNNVAAVRKGNRDAVRPDDSLTHLL
jgi:hypothetical protein